MSKTEKEKYLTVEQYQQFLSVISNLYYYTLFYVIGNYGLRVGEAIRLRIQDINFESKYIKIPTLKQDRNKGRLPHGKLPNTYIDMPLDDKTAILLEKYIDYIKTLKTEWLFPYKTRYYMGKHRLSHIPKWLIQRKFKLYAKQARLDSAYSVHSLRHYKGVSIYNNLKDIRAVQLLLRHKNINSTVIYTTMSLEDKRDLFDKIMIIDGGNDKKIQEGIQKLIVKKKIKV
jgi:integrase